MSRILMVASEAVPFSKTGGLADVLGALPPALAARGEEVAVVKPYYRATTQHVNGAHRVWDDLGVWLGTTHYPVQAWMVEDRGVRTYLLRCPELYDRPALYAEDNVDYPDNHIRFSVLCRGAIEVARRLFRPDVFHCHDWQASLVAPLLKTTYSGDPTFYGIKTLLTIHNLGYQGIFGKNVLADLAMDPALFHPSAMEFYGNLNFLKAGIVFSDALTTVSPTYAKEIQTPEYGFGLDGLLRSRAGVLTGILNGVDYNEWNPETDPLLTANYSSVDLSGKRRQKRDLLEEFGLPSDNLARPLIGIVSRFADQKGFDLITAAAHEMMREDLTLVVLGTGEPQYEDLFRGLAAAYPDRIAVRIGYDNGLAHRVEAGADIFLMPSRYEPCGLNQIYSLRYGTVPVVRATGGLDDTIDEETGFKFREYSGEVLLGALRTALTEFSNKKRWSLMMAKGMAKDFSWDASAGEYVRLYRQLIG